MRTRLSQFAEMVVLLALIATIVVIAVSAFGCNAWHYEIAAQQAAYLDACEHDRDACEQRLAECRDE